MANTKHVDTFRQRQQQLTSSALPMRDYSSHQPITKKYIDMDNLYDQKRQNDRNYSDLFDQCKNTGGQRPSPTRKKGDEIAVRSYDWTHQDLQSKLKKDYTNYNPKEQKMKEFTGQIKPAKVVEVNLSRI